MDMNPEQEGKGVRGTGTEVERVEEGGEGMRIPTISAPAAASVRTERQTRSRHPAGTKVGERADYAYALCWRRAPWHIGS
jgi:hypothetical protein